MSSRVLILTVLVSVLAASGKVQGPSDQAQQITSINQGFAKSQNQDLFGNFGFGMEDSLGQSPVSLLEQIEAKWNVESINRAASRRRREGKRQCGSHLLRYVMGVCGELCQGNSGIDIATTCCANQCDAAFIRKACCPL